ncbi:MAG: hypothetical protein R3C68_06790 [Myxococcota bacterium]
MATMTAGRIQVGFSLLVVWTTVLGGFIPLSSAQGATYYVAPNGNDSNLGTEVAPRQTLAAGIALLKAGDTLFLRQGSYVGSSAFTSLASGTSWDNAVTVRAYDSETATLTKGAGADSILHVGTDKQYIIFDGLIFDGGAGAAVVSSAVHSNHQQRDKKL